MDEVSIGATELTLEPLRARLNKEVVFLRSEGLRVTVAERVKGGFTFLGCNLHEDAVARQKNPRQVFRYCIARALTDLLLEEIPRRLLPGILRSHYTDLTPEETREVLRRAEQMLPSGPGGPEISPEAKARILAMVMEQLNQRSELVVDGFLRFRLKGLMRELNEIVDRAVDGFLMDREYQEFIRLVKYFVELQEPRLDEVHVVMRAPDSYRILSRSGEVIENEYLEGCIPRLGETPLDQEDRLISALITLAPRRIVLHLGQRNVVETVRTIFEHRAEVCPGCPRCPEPLPGPDV